MRVGFVGAHPLASSDNQPGGPDPLAALAEGLSQRGLDVTVYTHQHSCEEPDGVSVDAAYRVVRMPVDLGRAPTPEPMTDAKVAARLGDFTKFLIAEWTADPPDVVHADGWIYGVAAQLAATRLHAPCVQALPQLSTVVRRRQGRVIGPPARGRFERLLARGATRAVVSCTEDVLELAKLGCPRPRISVLPRGVDLTAFLSTGPVVERGAEHRIVALAADLLPYRGFEDLIEALSHTRTAELVIAGGPQNNQLDRDPDAARLRQAAIDRGVASRLHLTGALNPRYVPPLLRSADVLVCPSWYEPFGMAVVEAMACGIPVIASEAGGMVDTVVHEVTGLLVPPRSPRRLSAALNDMLHAGALRSGMGLAGRTRAWACYSWERVASEAHTVYERAIEMSHASARARSAYRS